MEKAVIATRKPTNINDQRELQQSVDVHYPY